MLNSHYLRKKRKEGQFNNCDTQDLDKEYKIYDKRMLIYSLSIGFLLLTIFYLFGCAQAMSSTIVIRGYSNEDICKAIYKAEGGSKTKHPYGILTKYKHTTPKQACLNTVAHARRDWVANESKGSFIHFLAGRYAPIGVSNDPNNLNENWESNVISLLKKGG